MSSPNTTPEELSPIWADIDAGVMPYLDWYREQGLPDTIVSLYFETPTDLVKIYLNSNPLPPDERTYVTAEYKLRRYAPQSLQANEQLYRPELHRMGADAYIFPFTDSAWKSIQLERAKTITDKVRYGDTNAPSLLLGLGFYPVGVDENLISDFVNNPDVIPFLYKEGRYCPGPRGLTDPWHQSSDTRAR